MNCYCRTTDPKLFNANVLSVNDEAFAVAFDKWRRAVDVSHHKVVFGDFLKIN
jgi:hypothetical protein